MSIPNSIVTSTEDVNLDQIHAQDREERDNVPRRRPGRGLQRNLLLLVRSPSVEEFLPLGVQDCPVLSSTRPDYLTRLPHDTWTEFYHKMRKAHELSLWGKALSVLSLLVYFMLVACLLWLGYPLLARATFVFAAVAVMCRFKRIDSIRSRVVQDYRNSFETAGYHLSLEKVGGDCFFLEIEPLANDDGAV